MFGINKIAQWERISDDSFYDPVVEFTKDITVRVQKQKLTTREQSNSYEMGQSTTYFITQDFYDYRKGDKILHNGNTYSINKITTQEAIYGEKLFYIRLDGVYNNG